MASIWRSPFKNNIPISFLKDFPQPLFNNQKFLYVIMERYLPFPLHLFINLSFTSNCICYYTDTSTHCDTEVKHSSNQGIPSRYLYLYCTGFIFIFNAKGYI